MWFTAEIIWTYYQLGLGVETPFPSLADVFWLAGYAPLTYHLYRIYTTVTMKVTDRDTMIVISSLVSAVLAFLLYLVFSISGQHQSVLELIINLAYPVLDAILLIPAIVILWSFRRSEPAYTHWVMISLFIVFVTVADIGFDYALAVDEDSASQQEWIWDMFYNAGIFQLLVLCSGITVFDFNKKYRSDLIMNFNIKLWRDHFLHTTKQDNTHRF